MSPAADGTTSAVREYGRTDQLVLRLSDTLVRWACRRLPEEDHADRLREWTAELYAILDDPGLRSATRTCRALLYAADQRRAVRALPIRPGRQAVRIGNLINADAIINVIVVIIGGFVGIVVGVVVGVGIGVVVGGFVGGFVDGGGIGFVVGVVGVVVVSFAGVGFVVGVVISVRANQSRRGRS